MKPFIPTFCCSLFSRTGEAKNSDINARVSHLFEKPTTTLRRHHNGRRALKNPIFIMDTLTQYPLFQSLPTLPLFLSFFLFIYLLANFLVFRNWSSKIRPEAASCLISIFHGTPAVFLATYAIITDPGSTFSSPNTLTQNRVLEFSIAYFLTDLLHYFIFSPGDVLFIAHHLAVLFVFATCRYTALHGAVGILKLLILAEVTSACQNAWALSGVRRNDVKLAAKLYDFIRPPFYALYTVVRGLLGPWLVYEMGVFFIRGGGDGVIPKWVWISWMVVVVMAISVSMLWISNLWAKLIKERRGKLDKKSS